MIFVNSVPRAIELSGWLSEMGWKSGHISSSLSQEQRISVMESMRDFKLRVLVCSDLIARGIDIDRVNLVVNIDYPWEIETYLHRVGRTGRFGTSGIALNLVGPEDELFMDRLRQTGIVIKPLPDHVSYSSFRKELTESEQERLERHQSQRANKKAKPLVFQKPAKRRPETQTKAAKRNKTQSSVPCTKKARDPVSDQTPVGPKDSKKAILKSAKNPKIIKNNAPLELPEILQEEPCQPLGMDNTANPYRPAYPHYPYYPHYHHHFLPTMKPLFFPDRTSYASPKHFTPPDLYF
ncbi:P-loop containing nucleoside triphosphate hydrolase protein [Phycomyces nitens]|nr:P-loop containing nucleoside triphosphate hydrolase protein [Phycomyces nitens]